LRLAHQANVDGTFNVLEGARAAGVRRVLFAGGESACASLPAAAGREGGRHAPEAPIAAQKLAGELSMQSYARAFGMETVCLRYAHVFGPRQREDGDLNGLIPRWARRMLQIDGAGAKRPELHGSGVESCDFTYVANVVYANLLALEAPAERVAGRVFDIGSGQTRSLLSLYRSLARLTGYPLAPVHTDVRPISPGAPAASLEPARTALGYRPLVGFEEGLALTVAAFREGTRRSSDTLLHSLQSAIPTSPPFPFG
jgi:nucleoside-diphosphate-sugar epimerase